MKYDNVKVGQRVQAKVDIYRTPHRKDKGSLLVERGVFGKVFDIDDEGEYLDIQVKWDTFVCGNEGYYWCNHKDIRKEKFSKDVVNNNTESNNVENNTTEAVEGVVNNLKIVAEYGRDYGVVGTPTGFKLSGVELHVGDVVVAEGFDPQFVVSLNCKGFYVMGWGSSGMDVFKKHDFKVIKRYSELKCGDKFGYLKVVENGK